MTKKQLTETNIDENSVSRCTSSSLSSSSSSSSSSNAKIKSERSDVSGATTSADDHQYLPAEIWAHSINYLLLNTSATNNCYDQQHRQYQHKHQPQTIQYNELLQLSTINRQFLHDVSCLIPTIHITSPSQLLHPKVAVKRFGPGVREVTIDCLFEVKVQQSNKRRTARTTKPAQPKIAIRPNADAYRHVASFLSALPNLERVVLGGHQILDRSLLFAEDGYTCKEKSSRNFHPLHTQPNSDIGIVSNLESFLRGESTLDDDTDDESTATASTSSTSTSTTTSTSANPFISAHQYDQRLQHDELKSNLICSLCDAYSSGAIPPNTQFLGLLSKSCCPARARNGGVVLAGPYAESCAFCTKTCKSFPIEDIKKALLDPTNYEESVFDRIFCMSSRRILQILVEREDKSCSLSSLVDVNFVAKCLVNKRFAVLSAILDLDLLPSVDEDAATFINDEVEEATSLNQIKPSISRYLFNPLVVEGGIALRPESFQIFE